MNVQQHAGRLLRSFKTLHSRNPSLKTATVSKLLNESSDQVHTDRDLVLLSAGTESPDPILNYGNQAALGLFEMDFGALTEMQAKRTAEPDLRAERQRLLHKVRDEGYVVDYSGIRVSATGKRFRINNATVWNVLDDNMEKPTHGQAAAFLISEIDFL